MIIKFWDPKRPKIKHYIIGTLHFPFPDEIISSYYNVISSCDYYFFETCKENFIRRKGVGYMVKRLLNIRSKYIEYKDPSLYYALNLNMFNENFNPNGYFDKDLYDLTQKNKKKCIRLDKNREIWKIIYQVKDESNELKDKTSNEVMKKIIDEVIILVNLYYSYYNKDFNIRRKIEVISSIIDKRNLRWEKRIFPFLEKNKDKSIAIVSGIFHILNNNNGTGILQLLKKHNYKYSQVKLPIAKSKPVHIFNNEWLFHLKKSQLLLKEHLLYTTSLRSIKSTKKLVKYIPKSKNKTKTHIKKTKV